MVCGADSDMVFVWIWCVDCDVLLGDKRQTGHSVVPRWTRVELDGGHQWTPWQFSVVHIVADRLPYGPQSIQRPSSSKGLENENDATADHTTGGGQRESTR